MIETWILCGRLIEAFQGNQKWRLFRIAINNATEMLDGIYSFSITAGGQTATGIATVQNDVIRCFSPHHVYFVERSQWQRKDCWRLKATRYRYGAQWGVSPPFPEILDGESCDDSFALKGTDKGYLNVKFEIQGNRLHDLP